MFLFPVPDSSTCLDRNIQTKGAALSKHALEGPCAESGSPGKQQVQNEGRNYTAGLIE